MHRFHTIPPHLPFLPTLAEMVLEQHKNTPLSLAQTLILLPSRRSCRSLREVLLKQSDGAPLLLPRILPIGEIDGEADLMALDNTPSPPIMPDKKRLGLLTRLILQGEPIPPARAYQLAIEMARLLDEVTKYDLSFDRLEQLAPMELAAHWQKTTQFMRIITHQWPHILEAEGKADRAQIMHQRTLALAKKWTDSPPDFPVIAAGSTGSVPATAALLCTIAHMPQGRVILPGLDIHMPEEAWQLIDPTHPQYGLKQLLENAAIERTQTITKHQVPSTKHAFSTLFTPAPLTAAWREAEPDVQRDFSHLSLMQSDTQTEEARMIAYLLRKALDTPEKTAALITPDRTLARMVSAECLRYGIHVDDSAGAPLSESPGAVFMRLILEVVETGAAPEPLLALLRHPFAALGMNTAACRELSRLLEKNVLRSVRLEPGMDALAETVKQSSTSPELVAFIARLRDALRPLEMLFIRNAPQPFSDYIALHCEVAERIATTENKNGAAILWEKDTGETLATLLAEWKSDGDVLGNIAPGDYPALFAALLSGEVTRPAYGMHPRLRILSPIEARLLHEDLVILGEMNEGTWPTALAVDPWMSAPMREAFGLPSHAVQIGQSAHDVWMLMHAPQVILSRSRKIFGVPQEPSRWWVRLTTLVAGKDQTLLEKMDISATMQATIEAQDASFTMAPLARPAPTPPLAARPRRFSVSDVELWHKEPYAFYAKKILRLRALDPLDQEPDAAEFGKLMHSALEMFSAEHPDRLPDHAYQQLLARGQQVFQPYLKRPAVINLWWPRFEAIAKHWLVREKILRKERYHTHSEVSAEWSFQAAGETVTLTARADRVDVMGNRFRLIDYKTGTPPTRKKVEEGEARQLPLTALALMRSERMKGAASSLVYWALKTREENKHYVEITSAESLLAHSEKELRTLVEESLQESTPYAAPTASRLSPAQDDYTHLIRRSEWGNS